MNILHPDINEYLHSVAPERDRVLSDMESYGSRINFPIVGPLVGRLLFSYCRMIKARRVLELGSGYGYSAFWFAKAMGTTGKVICTDANPENARLAERYFRRGKIQDRIDFRVGKALEIMDDLDGEFDIIFNDIDKHEYPKALRKGFPRLRKGGLFISDNVLWSGRIFDAKPDKATAGILTYNRMISTSRQMLTTIIPLRDGVSVSVKL